MWNWVYFFRGVKGGRRACLLVLVDEHESVGHIVVAQMYHLQPQHQIKDQGVDTYFTADTESTIPLVECMDGCMGISIVRLHPHRTLGWDGLIVDNMREQMLNRTDMYGSSHVAEEDTGGSTFLCGWG